MQKVESQPDFRPELILGGESLGNKMERLMSGVDFQNVSDYEADWNSFLRHFENMVTPEQREVSKENRRRWIEMRELGDKFVRFVEDEIKKDVDSVVDFNDETYYMIKFYNSLGASDAPQFLSKILNSKRVRESRDGSCIHIVLTQLGRMGGEEVIPQIVEFMKRVGEMDYPRRTFRQSDIIYALGAVQGIVGLEKTKQLVDELKAEDKGLSHILSSNIITLSIQQGFNVGERYTPEPFDKELELQRLKELDYIPLPPQEDYLDDPRDYDFEDEDFGRSSYVPDFCTEEAVKRGKPEEAIAAELAEAQRANIFVDQSIANSKLEARVASAAKLHVYNVMRRFPPESEERWREIDKIYRMSEIEHKYAEKNLLPTVGIEVEVPRENLSEDKVLILQNLGVKNTKEGLSLWEVNPDYSYSPLAQSRILQELAAMGAIPLKDGRVDEATPLSLHLNFGFLELDDLRGARIERRYTPDIELINDILTYGFASPGRILRRKTKGMMRSYLFKASKDNDYSVARLLRLELRTGEFKDYPTFRLIAEAQAVVGSLIAYIKVEEDYFRDNLHREPTKEELELADMWPKIRDEIKEFLAKESGLEPNAVDIQDNYAVVAAMEKPGFKEGCRRVISKNSRAILRKVFPGG